MIWVLPTAAMVAWLVRAQGTSAALIAKPLASTGFILVALAEGAADSQYGQVVLAGLFLGALGDVALMFERWFLGGLVLFLAGHVAFIVAFVSRSPITIATAGAGAVLGLLSAGWLLPKIEPTMRMPVAVYIVVISVMVSAGIGDGQHPFTRIGAPLFALSDLLVARERFVKSDPRNPMWGLPTYYAAQVLIALSVAT